MDLTLKSDVDQSQNSENTPLSNIQSSICLVRVAHFRTQTKNPENQSHQCSILSGASHQKDYQNIPTSCNCQTIPWQRQESKHLSVIKMDFPVKHQDTSNVPVGLRQNSSAKLKCPVNTSKDFKYSSKISSSQVLWSQVAMCMRKRDKLSVGTVVVHQTTAKLHW